MTHDCNNHECLACQQQMFSKGIIFNQHNRDYGSLQDCDCKDCEEMTTIIRVICDKCGKEFLIGDMMKVNFFYYGMTNQRDNFEYCKDCGPQVYKDFVFNCVKKG